ncbi:hypothetical protein RHGRI_027270 [Rhododendron griersonianum]|uniref:Uncharacterized protein n=1 Tax=Rhododendron griersonianum TaxID=479676 RepID=A0AAV6J0B5_9ERIC|nr:hypothetical protein RHGRI_027270 [Rhododendron griersonianum]
MRVGNHAASAVYPHVYPLLTRNLSQILAEECPHAPKPKPDFADVKTGYRKARLVDRPEFLRCCYCQSSISARLLLSSSGAVLLSSGA